MAKQFEQECVNGHTRPKNEFICKTCGTPNWKTTQEPQYPEHAKLEKVQKTSQTIGEFLEWLKNAKGITFYQRFENLPHGTEIDFPYTRIGAVPFVMRKQEVLAEFFGINLKELEKEKTQMLEKIRRTQKQ